MPAVYCGKALRRVLSEKCESKGIMNDDSSVMIRIHYTAQAYVVMTATASHIHKHTLYITDNHQGKTVTIKYSLGNSRAIIIWLLCKTSQIHSG